MLEFHGDSEAAGLLLEHCIDRAIDPAQSLALEFREGQPKPTLILMSSLGPIFTGEGISVQGVTCGFMLCGMEERVEDDGTKTLHASSALVWPPESVVRDSNGKFNLPEISMFSVLS
jgi:hypothetical protein